MEKLFAFSRLREEEVGHSPAAHVELLQCYFSEYGSSIVP